MLSVCGNRCDLCPRYRATLSEDRQELSKVARLWIKADFRQEDITIESIRCNGCLCGSCGSMTQCAYGVRECAKMQLIDNCGECPQYPCPKLDAAFTKTGYYREALINKLSEQEYKLLEDAFFHKKERLDEVNKEKYKDEKSTF